MPRPFSIWHSLKMSSYFDNILKRPVCFLIHCVCNYKRMWSIVLRRNVINVRQDKARPIWENVSIFANIITYGNTRYECIWKAFIIIITIYYYVISGRFIYKHRCCELITNNMTFSNSCSFHPFLGHFSIFFLFGVLLQVVGR